MKISYNWLKEFVNFSLRSEELAEKLTYLGLEVAAIIPWDKTKYFDKIIVAEIKEIQPHPQADRLTVCIINDGKDNYSIVCGAKNIRVGQKVPLALPGAVLPGNKRIEKTSIRGIESSGMLCSAQELELGKNAGGILILPENALLGTEISKTLGLANDFILELELTPNRGDCLSHLGIAREIAALLNLSLHFPQIDYLEVQEEKILEIKIQEPELCHRYVGRVIDDLKTAPSPIWLSERLESCGVRALNNLIDITNYVLLELGQPLHAFDYQKIGGQKIVVRRAHPKEKIKALDGKEYELNSENLVIADSAKPVAVAGIVGGEETAVSENTETIILESAYFQPKAVRRSVQKLNLSTESSYRFERNVDIENVEIASRRAAYLYQTLAGGKVLKNKNDVYPTPHPVKKIFLSQDYLEKILGIKADSDRTIALFNRLGLITSETNVSGNGRFSFSVAVPTYRNDLEKNCDLAEELARLWGYDRIPTPLLSFNATNYLDEVLFSWEQKIREILVGLGFYEVINYSLVPGDYLEEFNFVAADLRSKPVKIANPLSAQGDTLRTTLIPGLVGNLSFNVHHQNLDLKFFEVGRIFYQEKNAIREKRMLALALTGKQFPVYWQEKTKDIDFYYLTGVISAILKHLGLDEFQIVPGETNLFSPQENIQILALPSPLAGEGKGEGEEDEKVLGFAGRLHPKLEKKYDLSPSFFAELDGELIFSYLEKKKKIYQPIPKYPSVKRDISLLLPEKITIAEIIGEIKKTGKNLLSGVELFDLYQGEKIPAGQRSLSFSLIYQHYERTLTETEVNALNEEIVRNLESKFDAKRRT